MDRGVIFSPSPHNRSADLFGFAISFKFGAVRFLTNMSKERRWSMLKGVSEERQMCIGSCKSSKG